MRLPSYLSTTISSFLVSSGYVNLLLLSCIVRCLSSKPVSSFFAQSGVPPSVKALQVIDHRGESGQGTEAQMALSAFAGLFHPGCPSDLPS